MPGIHIREASWIDWTQRRENSTLTVPGSYWLCHKNNIYKFIFRYHRTFRNIEQFNYEKELMKVVRRVIKNQPPQGQQFGTNHLLVTFNRISWTRQDKIFALMKFQERSVAAFSHAFILTIKLTDLLEIEQDSKYVLTPSPSDQSLIYQNENSKDTCIYEDKGDSRDKKYLTRSSINSFSDKKYKHDNVQEQTLVSETKSIQLDNRMLNSNLERLSVNKESLEQITNNEDTNNFNKSFNDLHKVSITSKSIGKDYVEYKGDSVPNNSRILNDNNTVDDVNSDSANLPYQYLIEKEIENAKKECNKNNSMNCAKLHSNTRQIEDSPCLKKKKYELNNIQRSSDITDLVMEGLMFTIHQGQDAVAVIEQKTKLEVDEVLENSEKIETEEGEKCLRNSSLLGLENLITMIESPKENKFGQCQNAINQDSSLNRLSTTEHLFNNTIHPLTNKIKKQSISSELKHMEWQPSSNNSTVASTSLLNNDNSLSIINKRHYSEIYNNYKCKENMKFARNKDTEFKKEVEETGIIPEALQNENFQPPILSLEINKDKLKCIPHKNLLVDNADNEFKSCFNNNLQSKEYLENNCLTDHEVTMNFVMNQEQELHVNTSESKFKNTAKHKLNSPVVISNKIITLNEIPPQLQKIVINKLSMKHNSLSIKDKTQSNEKEDNALNTQLKNQIFSSNIVTNTQCPEDYHKSICNKKIHCESKLPETLNVEVNNPDTSIKNIKVIKEESQEQHNSTDNEKTLQSGTIKDITEEFYKDLSHLQKKKNLINQKYLRSRKKSLSIPNDTNNDEIYIQTVKFFQDITRGAKVVIRRINVNKYS